MPATDEELMQRVRDGDRDALEELVRRYHRPLLNFAARFLDDRDAADDVVQETFLRVLGSAPRWRARAKVSTYLYTIASRLCCDELKRARRTREEPLEEGEDGPLDGDPSPEAQALADLRAEKVRAAVRRPLRPEFNLCPYCGPVAFQSCPECQAKLEVGWRWCPYCHASLERLAQAMEEMEEEP